MSDPHDRQGGAPPAGESERDTPTYQGSRFPWWLTILYAAFLIWGLTYMSLFFFPDLRSWLAR
jgi:hypothetical protein